MKFKSGRGGVRPNAGRPKGIRKPNKLETERRQTIGVRLPPWMVQWLKNHDEPAGRIMEEALINYYKLKYIKCNYCYNTQVYKQTWRGLSADATIERIKILIKDYGIKGILFSDDNFFGRKDRALKILKTIKKEKISILCSKIDAHLSVLSKLTDEELNLLKDSGCKMVMIGVESGSQRILELLEKTLKIPDLLKFLPLYCMVWWIHYVTLPEAATFRIVLCPIKLKWIKSR